MIILNAPSDIFDVITLNKFWHSNSCTFECVVINGLVVEAEESGALQFERFGVAGEGGAVQLLPSLTVIPLGKIITYRTKIIIIIIIIILEASRPYLHLRSWTAKDAATILSSPRQVMAIDSSASHSRTQVSWLGFESTRRWLSHQTLTLMCSSQLATTSKGHTLKRTKQ